MEINGLSVRLTLFGKPLKKRKFRCACQMSDIRLPEKTIQSSGDLYLREIKALCKWRRRWNNHIEKVAQGKMTFSEYFEKRAELLVHKPRESIERHSAEIVAKCDRCHRTYPVLVTVECPVKQKNDLDVLYLFEKLKFKEGDTLNVALERVAVKSGRFSGRDQLKRFLTDLHASTILVKEYTSSLEQNLNALAERVSTENAKSFLNFLSERLKLETQSFVKGCEKTLKAYLSDIAEVITQMKLKRLGVHEEIEVLASPI